MSDLQRTPFLGPDEAAAQERPADKISFDFRAMLHQVEALLDKQIFFVGGVEKSGTSWLQRLLDLHPEVTCTGEYHLGESLFPAIRTALDTRNNFSREGARNPLRHEMSEGIQIHDFRDLLYLFTSAVALLLLKSTGKSPKAIGERSAHNVYHFEHFAVLLPGIKCIQIVRDPRDVAVSQWHHIQLWAPPDHPIRSRSKSAVAEEYATLWMAVVARGVQFGQRNPERYFELRYEDLIERTAQTLSPMFRFLGVDDSLEVAQHCADAASFEKLTGGRRRGQEDTRSFFRKGVAGDWKNHLDAKTNADVIARAGPMMRHFGYL